MQSSPALSSSSPSLWSPSQHPRSAAPDTSRSPGCTSWAPGDTDGARHRALASFGCDHPKTSPSSPPQGQQRGPRVHRAAFPVPVPGLGPTCILPRAVRRRLLMPPHPPSPGAGELKGCSERGEEGVFLICDTGPGRKGSGRLNPNKQTMCGADAPCATAGSEGSRARPGRPEGCGGCARSWRQPGDRQGPSQGGDGRTGGLGSEFPFWRRS